MKRHILVLSLFWLAATHVQGQERSTAPPQPPGLVILKLKWERQLDPSPRPPRPAHDASRSASDPDALNNPGGLQTTGRSPFPPYIYQYSVEVRNDRAQSIRWVSWEYVLSEPGSKREMGRHKFVSSEKIGPAKMKTLRGRTHSLPTRVVSAGSLGKGKEPAYAEHVEFRCVAYDDGNWWHHPSLQESECVEMEKRGKSR